MGTRAVIFGCAGPALSPAERRFFAEALPWGFILFARNLETPEQMRRLTEELRASVGRDAPVLIDQEGGRVARMRGPAWREWAPALDECERLGDIELRARVMYLRYRVIAAELRAVGVDVNCAPVLDLAGETTHPVLRNRCYGREPDEVARIGRAVAEGLLEGGVVPVMKHLPGQGRATLDSHRALPVIGETLDDLARDFAPFRALADLPMAMTAHVIFTAIDPDAPATQSAAVLQLIRRDLGFDGLLLTDDLSMRALEGGFAARAERAIAAGCDVVLHCNGAAREMAEIAGAVPELGGAAALRAERTSDRRGTGTTVDHEALDADLARLREGAAHAG